MIEPASHVAAMSAYALADLEAPAGKSLVSLSQNESVRGPSPSVTEAVASAIATAHFYPDPDWVELRQTLAHQHSIPFEGIICGNGSMELIAALAKSFADETGAILAPRHAYPFFRTAALLARARFDTAPEKDERVSVAALLDAHRTDTKIVFVANPGNPTGTRIAREDIVTLRDELPEKTLLVIDEAYGEFADHLGEPLYDLVERGDTVILRTFSKAYGLAGMRVGWELFPIAIAREIQKVLNPNNVSVAGQAAAVAALKDQRYMRETCDLTAALREGLAARLRSSEFDVADSFTNFLLIRFSDGEMAADADLALRKEGVFLRAQSGAGLPHCLRMTIGAKADLDFAASLLESWKEGQGR